MDTLPTDMLVEIIKWTNVSWPSITGYCDFWCIILNSKIVMSVSARTYPTINLSRINKTFNKTFHHEFNRWKRSQQTCS